MMSCQFGKQIWRTKNELYRESYRIQNETYYLKYDLVHGSDLQRLDGFVSKKT